MNMARNIRCERGAWGLFDLTDAQAEKINSGDVEEFNAFFLRNYDYIKSRCMNQWNRLIKVYYSSKDLDDLVNAAYYDLSKTKFVNSKVLERVINLACVAVDRSSAKIAVSVSADNYNRSFSCKYSFDSLDYMVSNQAQTNESEFCIADLYQTAPSPQEEIEAEEESYSFIILADAVKPFLTDAGRRFITYYLNGITPSNAEIFLNVKGGWGAYRQIEKSLALNYKEVLRVFADLGYKIPAFLKDQIPEKYAAEIQRKEERERAKQDALDELERKRAEREARAQTKAERLREYNREYQRRRRAREKTLPAYIEGVS
jgi:hypothetical protein